jgi:hypothetical protein
MRSCGARFLVLHQLIDAAAHAVGWQLPGYRGYSRSRPSADGGDGRLPGSSSCRRCTRSHRKLIIRTELSEAGKTNTPRRVSSFINRVMILCNTVCNAFLVGAGA